VAVALSVDVCTINVVDESMTTVAESEGDTCALKISFACE
jgi:hypothetical protein